VALEKIKASFEALERKAAGRDDTLVKKKIKSEDSNDAVSAAAVAEMNFKLVALQDLLESQKSEIEQLKVTLTKDHAQETVLENVTADESGAQSAKYEELIKSINNMHEDLENYKTVSGF
jgi:uncharacterized small protein (DUF1192 family)